MLITVKHCEVDLFGLICLLNTLINKLKQVNKYCYVDWLAVNLGIKKADLTRVLLDNPHIFKLVVGKKTGKIIIREISEYRFTLNNTYKVGVAYYTPLCYLLETKEIVYKVEKDNKIEYGAEKADAFSLLLKTQINGEKNEFERSSSER